MCGIAGLLGDLSEETLRRQLRAMVHRGPDAEGIHVGRGVLLGSRRLSIIDLEGGDQPVSNETGDVTVVLNGEIYNYRELREQLEAKGHRFRTRSDTESIVHAYEEWGLGFAARLRGMFGIAIHDARSGAGRLVLARDRAGIKPIYLAEVPGGVAFASEVRSLLATGLVARRVSPDALASFLLFGSVCEPDTLVAGVRSLPAASIAVVDVGSTQLKVESYWDHPAPADAATGAPAAVRAALEDAVRAHLVADVPVGLFLSSGVDSTVIAGLAAAQGQDLRTFTVTYRGSEGDESEEARRTAERFGTRHTEAAIDVARVRALLPEALAAMDQPTQDGVNTFVVSRAAASAGLKVALTGLGGDEVFGGYGTFRQVPAMERAMPALSIAPGMLRGAVAAIANRRGAAGAKLGAFLADPRALPHPYFAARLLLPPERVARLSRVPLEGAWRGRLQDLTTRTAGLSSFHRISLLEQRHYMQSTLLRDADVMSMASSLELRPPLLDHHLVELAFRLPAHAHAGRPKALLRQATSDLLSPVVDGQRKRTFTLPWAEWLRGGLGQEVERGLADLAPSLAPALRAEEVRSVWSAFQDGRTTWSRPWALHVLNAWAWRHLDGKEVAG